MRKRNDKMDDWIVSRSKWMNHHFLPESDKLKGSGNGCRIVIISDKMIELCRRILFK